MTAIRGSGTRPGALTPTVTDLAEAPVLAPLADRYVRDSAPLSDGVVRAMPVVLRLERPPAARTPVLEAAAAAALALCLDPRAQPGGEWHDAVTAWVSTQIRKIARRARGAHWAAVQELPGVTWSVGGAEARALLPGPVDDVPRIVSRLQIGGTELEPDDPGPAPPGVPVIWVNAGLEMTVGKAAAQVGHASMLYAAAHGLTSVPAFAVRDADGARWERLCAAVERGAAVAVRDAGFTEVAPGTITTIAA
ncbi:peptidyl-tRNA hydrolase [Pseudonocardia kunmingensis]|uniref:Peptidyl-tRNA hydrolase n=1 Tax=Pseudonocardia kunmingensis TaxID=630975 RepID=A0A543CYA9_9PSEU|nr:peptidyl-tRNA hydrolase [Pseudonocardia kunmingensis]